MASRPVKRRRVTQEYADRPDPQNDIYQALGLSPVAQQDTSTEPDLRISSALQIIRKIAAQKLTGKRLNLPSERSIFRDSKKDYRNGAGTKENIDDEEEDMEVDSTAAKQSSPSVVAQRKISNLLTQTVRAGEGNSLLIIGPRSSNSTGMIRDILTQLRMEDDSQLGYGGSSFHTIWLNGLIHTDDKLAVREIWRQLGVEMNLQVNGMEEDVSGKSYADTLAKLLATLSYSHPNSTEQPATDASDMNGQQQEQQQRQRIATKSVIFVLQDFDLFTYHHRQTLLYNLFDIAQSSPTPIAVIGLTTNVNVVDLLEKRVKSRFSQRYVFLPRPADLESFVTSVRNVAIIRREELTAKEVDELVGVSDNDVSGNHQHFSIEDGDITMGSEFGDGKDATNGVANDVGDELINGSQTSTPSRPKRRRKSTSRATPASSKSKKRTPGKSVRNDEETAAIPENATSTTITKASGHLSLNKNKKQSTIPGLLNIWNNYIASLLSSPHIYNQLSREFYTTKCLPSAYNIVSLALFTTPIPIDLHSTSSLTTLNTLKPDIKIPPSTPTKPKSTPKSKYTSKSKPKPPTSQPPPHPIEPIHPLNLHLQPQPHLQNLTLRPPSTNLSSLTSLPLLALHLLISACRLDLTTGSDICNLHMAYAEYLSLITRSKIRSSLNLSSSLSTIPSTPSKSQSARHRRLLDDTNGIDDETMDHTPSKRGFLSIPSNSNSNSNSNSTSNLNRETKSTAYTLQTAHEHWNLLIARNLLTPNSASAGPSSLTNSVLGSSAFVASTSAGGAGACVSSVEMCRVEVRLEELDSVFEAVAGGAGGAGIDVSVVGMLREWVRDI